MYNDPNESPLSKAILTGLFAGIMATLVCFVFEIIYRMVTWYGPSDFINVSSIIFIVNLILLVAGLAYYGLKSSFKKANLIFSILTIITTAFLVWKSESFHRFADYKLSMEFSHLLSGVLLIIGLFTLLIPVFFGNKKLGDFIL
jgi:hypothetical protein